jgi:hypothetical protein
LHEILPRERNTCFRARSPGVPLARSGSVSYWWEGDPKERYWVEIRFEPGIGKQLFCSVTDRVGKTNAWYDLVGRVAVGDIVYHWNAIEHRFVGRSVVAEPPSEVGRDRTVRLAGFIPLRVDVDLTRIRGMQDALHVMRSHLERNHPGEPLYLPFQYRRDGLRMMSNYFAKLPAEAAELLFDDTGMAEAEAPSPPASEGPPATVADRTTRSGSFLKPFKPRADTEYMARIAGGAQRRGRYHERLVTDFANLLETSGLEIAYNAAIDLAVLDPPVIIEAKIIGTTWSSAVRQAVGQLYEYRFFEVVDPRSELVFLASKDVPDTWVEYLERDRHIGVAWRSADGAFDFSPVAKRTIGLDHIASGRS